MGIYRARLTNCPRGANEMLYWKYNFTCPITQQNGWLTDSHTNCTLGNYVYLK